MNTKPRKCTACGNTKAQGQFKRLRSKRFGADTFSRVCNQCARERDVIATRKTRYKYKADFDMRGQICELYVNRDMTEIEIAKHFNIPISRVRDYLLSYFGDGTYIEFHIIP